MQSGAATSKDRGRARPRIRNARGAKTMTVSTRLGGFAGLLGGLVLAIAPTVFAHHSFAMFDHTRTVTIKGKVTLFQWTNPHGYIEVDAPGPDGAVKHYTLELTSVNMLQRAGWRSNMIKAGDEVK